MNTSATAMKSQEPSLTVYFDGACPLCRREIGFYQKRTQSVDYCDVSVGDGNVAEDLNREDALRRFHVRTEDGDLLSGAAAFAEVWKFTPGFEWLGRVIAKRPFVNIAEFAYRAFLIGRPYLQWLARLIDGSSKQSTQCSEEVCGSSHAERAQAD
ncbi:MAG: DUF393 domain-containing protein [Pseudomonadota bacterium]